MPKIKTNKIIPATYDPVFKAVMQSKRCRRYLVEILGDITKIPKDIIRKRLVFENTELPIKNINEKRKITDLVIRIEHNVINLEMNNSYYDGLLERNEAYLSNLKNISVGEKYSSINKIIQINFDNFDKYENIVMKFVIMDEKTHIKETENYEKYHINLKKIKEKYYNKEKLNDLEKKLVILTINDKSDLEDIAKEDDIMEDVKNEIIELSEEQAMVLCYDEEEYREFVRRKVTETEVREGIEKGLQKEREKSIQKGIQKGIEKGIQKGIEKGTLDSKINIAKSLINQNVDINIIKNATGLSIKELEKLKN